MDMTERTLRDATEQFRLADSHLQDTERYLRKLLMRLQRTSSPSPARVMGAYALPRTLEEPVPAGS